MNKLIAIVVYALSLYGFDLGGIAFDLHPTAVDAATIQGKVVMYPGLTRFECLRSSSGQCHYTLYPRRRCAAPVQPLSSVAVVGPQREARCGPRQFSLPSGDRRQVLSLAPFDVCISAGPASRERDCTVPNAFAER